MSPSPGGDAFLPPTSPLSQPFDPSHYVEHVTRTALLLEQLARDVRALRDQTDTHGKGVESIRACVSVLEMGFAVFKVASEGEIAACQTSVSALEEKLRWLSRLVIGSLVTGIIGGLIAAVWRMLS